MGRILYSVTKESTVSERLHMQSEERVFGLKRKLAVSGMSHLQYKKEKCAIPRFSHLQYEEKFD